ncbi:hypothetical protein LTR33_006408 [Friedmanniomyces endolithicus]|nr:hypothetical protein LTR33_006408 [Friedmanniomyces endolithicus]
MATTNGTQPEGSYFEHQRALLVNDVAASLERVLQNINKLNRSLEGVIAVGSEFGQVEGLWSQFENVMAKEPEKEGAKNAKEGAADEGLAVSGGVDSMALASLSSETTQATGHYSPLIGFIVDHKLRKDSTEEARNVAEELRRLQIEPRVLTLDWRPYGNPLAIDHLEHVARKLRYQAIGRACRENGIRSLLVAHHADDQAETVLMRIVGKYFGSGLGGIRSVRPIPECHSIYGVDRSGSPRSAASGEKEVTDDAHEMLIEGGGVDVTRPLLTFTKAELIDYCIAAEVRWFEDHTNADPRFALRNTIRHLQTNELLPAALRQPRLLEVAARVREQAGETESGAQREYDRLDISLDVRTGTATFKSAVRFRAVGRNVKTALVRKLLSLVAPIEEIKSLDVYHVAESIWPELDVEKRRRGRRTPTQIANVTITPSSGAGSGIWTLARQVPTRKDAASKFIVLSQLSTWQLWDGRYWIRICQRHAGNSPLETLEVVIRFLQQDDIASLMKTLTSAQRLALRELLSLAPGNLRFTLSVLIARKVSSGTIMPDGERVVALPSLGWSADGWARRPEDDSLEDGVGREDPAAEWLWDIRYKKVNLANGGSHRIVARLPDVRSSRDEAERIRAEVHDTSTRSTPPSRIDQIRDAATT